MGAEARARPGRRPNLSAMSATAAALPAPATRSRRELTSVFAALMLAVLLASLDGTIVSTALPTITAELGGLNQLSWVVTGYLLASTISTPLYGKLGDLYGRKRLFQGSILVFLAGSALCGLSQNMAELIAFRTLQGFGGGGLVVLAQAIIGDIVSPRDRGRYQGVFGGVFGLSSVAGPLIGGFLVDNASWRWIFYVNLPIGLLAVAVIAVALDLPTQRRDVRIDVAGTMLLSLGAGAFVLATSLGGHTYPWGSWEIVGLGVVSVLATAALIGVERRAPEPVLPLRLFSSRVFAVASAMGFIVGTALFGATTYLPLFMQVVNGASPTSSGLQLLPLMLGLVTTSIASGQIIARWGRYRPFPIAGTAILTVGFLLLSTMGPGTSTLSRSLFMAVVGLGLGMVMQVLVLAVQNDADYRDLGVATAGATFFRSIGGCFGVAICGAIFTNRLAHELSSLPGLPAGLGSGRATAGSVAALPPGLRSAFVDAYADALSTVFLACAPIAALAFVLAWLLPEKQLRHTVAATGVGEAFAAPKHPDPLGEIERALSTLSRRDSRERILEQLCERAGVELSPRQCWVLARVGEREPTDAFAIADAHGVDPGRVAARLAELRELGYVEGPSDAIVLTEAGRDALARLIAARRERLAELLEGWSPESEADLAALLARMAREVVADHPDGAPRGREPAGAAA
ncbi:MAG TPA: MFS transporter [Solirubrobacteraceae bacterium]